MAHGPDFSEPFIKAVITVKNTTIHLNIKKQQGRIESTLVKIADGEEWTVRTNAYPQINHDGKILFLCGATEGKHEALFAFKSSLKAHLLAFELGRVLKKLNEKWKEGNVVLVDYKPVSYD